MGIESTRIGILLFDGVEELDAVGPWEVLSAWATIFPQDGVGVSTYSPGGSMVTCAGGNRLYRQRGCSAVRLGAILDAGPKLLSSHGELVFQDTTP